MKLLKLRTLGVLCAAFTAASAMAQTVTLRLHHFLPPQATIPANAITPWAKKIEEESQGRLRVQIFPAMQMGGTPPQLYDQAKDGVVDVIWTVLGYTPNRFVRTEVFEIPFIAPSGPGAAEATSKAAWEFVQKHASEEFRDVKLLAVHTHGPGLFHTRNPITHLESLRGMKIRGGTRIVNNMLVKLGATPVGMPVPAVTEALSRGVIDGTTIPWEVAPSVKVTEIVKNHTAFSGDKGLYNMAFAFAMNRNTYDRLPADLKKVIDNNSGLELSAAFGRAMDQGDKAAYEEARKTGNNIVVLGEAETRRFLETAASVEADWVNEMRGRGIDGAKLAAEARALIAKHSGK
ncbi:TRAP transporter substrate-binding protein [Tepidicella xavieri]|uniref:TRAP-type C4-dicarboxylate transport system substrate-binding protein n=1 Tax=Tepidicella xavieri TaxID=360241 RepID=A0A4R6UHI3_9BURK|nr:TRAP transporter substrate-binding protein [Tepidicella xavieri]TDQ44769.1 TRAP-type C4-dicarboxylate transport system substrate-binding protein [Tepidicella xavieri]